MDEDKVNTKRDTILEDWRKFYTLLIVFAVLVFAPRGIAENISGQESGQAIIPLLMMVQMLSAIASGIVTGFYAYKFSKNGWAILVGLLGPWWGIILPPLIGAWIVQSLKNKALRDSAKSN